MTSVATDLKCQNCGAEFSLPDLTGELTRDVATIAQTVGRVNAMLELKNRTPIALSDAKAIAVHLSEGDTCHRCGTKLNENTAQNCPQCRSLNLRW
jgi:DNA-directed RNA polymerase subunit RPC12/RpoP